MSKWLKKVLPTLNGNRRGGEASCPWLAERLPALNELLTLTQDEGKPRTTATLTIFAEGRAFKVMLKDRQTNQVLFLTSEGFLNVLDALEAALQSGTGDWRADKWAEQKNGKK